MNYLDESSSRQKMKPLVSIVNYKNLSSVARAIELCDGFKYLTPTCRVLLKPNICGAFKEGGVPPFGAVTTTRVIEGTVRALKYFGVNDISIGEGSVLDEFGTNTSRAYKCINIHKLAKFYGVKLIDFNAGPHKRMTVEDVTMNIAVAALDTDFFINLPVLKTHHHTMVSLAGKNLKGCMSIASKKFFHGKNSILHYRISRLIETVPQHLVIIDGIYAMEHGPDPTVGTAHARGILVASTDFLAADSVGTRLLGGNPNVVEHLKLYAERHRKLDVLKNQQAIEIRGEPVEDHIQYLAWETNLEQDIKASGHTGLEVKLINDTLCCGCYGNLTGSLLFLAALSRNKEFHGLRIVAGKSLKDDRNSPRTFLFGNCAIKENKHLDKATTVRGCPPKFFRTCSLLVNQMPGLSGKVAFYGRVFLALVRALMGIGYFPLPRYEKYKSDPSYDIEYFTFSK